MRLLLVRIVNKAKLFGVAKLRDHRPRNPGDLLNVRRGTRGNIVLTEHKLFGHPSTHRHRDLGSVLGVAHRQLVALRQR